MVRMGEALWLELLENLATKLVGGMDWDGLSRPIPKLKICEIQDFSSIYPDFCPENLRKLAQKHRGILRTIPKFPDSPLF